MSQTPGIRKPSVKRYLLRILNVGISSIVFVLDRMWFHLLRLLQRDACSRCIVLYYHSIPREYAKRFEEQMRLMVKLAVPLDLRNLECKSRKKTLVGITFDDSLESFYQHAVPVLLALKIPATVFAVVDAFGAQPSWGAGYYLTDERVMSAKNLESLPDLITIGSHTRSHVSLISTKPEMAREEIAGSRHRLESMFNRPITLFSFPHGHLNDALVSQCREAGYQRVFTTEPRCVGEDDFVVGRVSADPWDWGLEFRLKMMGAYRWRVWAGDMLKRMVGSLPFGNHTLKKQQSKGFRKALLRSSGEVRPRLDS
jgi:peptidoglycan/xylan/chitin deacetylase (PgdA/CDA1 family)